MKDGDGILVFYKESRSWCVKIFYCNELSMYDYYTALDDICKIDSKAIVINGCNSFYDERCFKCDNQWYSYNKSNIESEIELVEYYYLRQTKIYE